MASDYQKAANEARNHSDNARRSSDEHLEQLARMQKIAVTAEKDRADRSAHSKQLKQTAVKQV